MASPITTSTGLGSGLEIGTIVEALVSAEKTPKQNQITKSTTANTASLSAVSQLKSALATFKTTLDTLNSTTTPAFLGFAATSSNESAVKATATNSAVNGTYSIKVVNLATASKVATAAIDTATASAIPSGELTISQNGINHKVTIADGSTLQQVRDKVNSDLQGKGITANIITDQSGSRLVFSSTTTGAGSDISVKGSGSIGTLLDIDGTTRMTAGDATSAGAIKDLATDATIEIDGLTVTSKSNKIDSAISGLTMELLPAAVNTTSTVTVATNTEGLQKSLQSFVDAFNTLVTLTKSLTSATQQTDGTYKNAAMTGDSMPRALLASIRNEIATATSTSGLGSLSQLGIMTSQTDGKLTLNSTTFTTALNDKKLGSQIQTLFTGDNGLLARVGKAIEPYTKSDGVLAQRTTSLNKTTTRLAADQEALDRRIETLTTTLTKKYNAMDLVVAQLKATASSVTSIFEAMNAQKNAS
ncbi:flagellar hook protein FliD [Pseudomonas sp. v388]|uniref:flagellar filament capping protein FliD n=1 Tax=Pseudomonas sp. v388 TaxID=2479849 RepID=UPI000F76FD51|nr:flagellar filament capping protein FliD [Pseudomonas sp. v388]RRV07431.1 flagellar hook protein FliD [Pseudomonas sp. v388]